MRLPGKVALVTGAARGIGLEIVRQFHLEGAEVYALDLAFDKAFPSSRELGKVRAMECDVADRTAVDKLLAEIVEEHPSIDILVNNAGVNPEPSPIEKTPLDNLETILATNLKSIFHLTSAVLPSMPKGGGYY